MMRDGYFHGRFYDGMYRNAGMRYGTFATYFAWHNDHARRDAEKMVTDVRAAQLALISAAGEEE